MKHLYQLPTDEVIVNCLANDVIGRNQDVVNFCEVIDSFEFSTIVSLDGAWGCGKTFFVKQAKMLIDWKCKPESLSEELFSSLTRATNANPKIYKNVSFNQNHSSVYYDAWENDDTSDPILSIINAIIKSKQVKLHIPNERDFVGILASITECVTGRSVNAIYDAIKGDNLFEDLRKHESINELMKRFLEAAIGKESNRLVIFVDELDRCKPSFAVLLLERIKHFFNDYRITFVFSINRDQLQHTIRNFYGNDINASKYLDKFFDLNIHIPVAYKNGFLSTIGFAKTSFFIDTVCYTTIERLNLELREIAKYVQHLKATIYDEMHREDVGTNRDSASIFFMIFISPILIALQIIDNNRYESFINGEDPTPLNDIVTGPEFANIAQHWLLGDTESYAPRDGDQRTIKVNFEDRLFDVYRAIFKERYLSSQVIHLGKMDFNSKSKVELLKLINPVSNFSK